LAFAEGLAEAGADVAIFDVLDPVPAFFEIEKNFGVKTKHYKYTSIPISIHQLTPFAESM
jgi:hypothetical protein